ncbi:hypothetical protein CHS0354_000244 [Potamilus streckersoni]|uniref:Uncharacterized protein n=1 Tax=Potamilus streckersoni TaxID=2493646 RepID=A0AAE0VIE3_9BIVA|nr:hypothetical protein CHS0354_000244 [Potamilus streckersoni]
MANSTDCNIVILHLKDARKNYRMEICRENFEIIQNGAIVIEKLFKTIYFFPESFSNHAVQAHMTKNSYRIFPTVHKCLRSLNQQSRYVVLVDNKRVYATDKTDTLAQILQDLSNNYGTVFELEYDAVKNCLKEKIKTMNGVNDVISLKQKRKKINALIPQRKMEGELKGNNYCPNLEIMFKISSRPIFRTNNNNPASLMEVVNSNIDPYSLTEEQSSLGEIVADCAEQDSIVVRSTPQPHPTHQTHTRNNASYNATVSNNNPTYIGQLEQAFSSSSIPLSVHDTQEQNGNRQRSPRYPRYDARIASYATFREFRTLNTEGMARTGLFYTGKADEVQCFQCGIEHKNWRPDKDPLLEHIKESPDCQFLETLLGVDTLNQYKAQIRSSEKISVREYFSSSYTNGGATGGSCAPEFTDSDHIRSPQYQAYTVRLYTFTKWPTSMTQRPEQVAQAGFFYTGLNDVVRCFACDGGLKNWDPEDEPWIEHARWFPQCPFVQKVKGQSFIALVRRMAEVSDEEEDVVVHSTFQRNNPTANHSESQNLTVGDDTDEPSQLDTDAAKHVIKMGYSRSTVAIAIDLLISKEGLYCTRYHGCYTGEGG